jgi:hypothetical protein
LTIAPDVLLGFAVSDHFIDHVIDLAAISLGHQGLLVCHMGMRF